MRNFTYTLCEKGRARVGSGQQQSWIRFQSFCFQLFREKEIVQNVNWGKILWGFASRFTKRGLFNISPVFRLFRGLEMQFLWGLLQRQVMWLGDSEMGWFRERRWVTQYPWNSWRVRYDLMNQHLVFQAKIFFGIHSWQIGSASFCLVKWCESNPLTSIGSAIKQLVEPALKVVCSVTDGHLIHVILDKIEIFVEKRWILKALFQCNQNQFWQKW